MGEGFEAVRAPGCPLGDVEPALRARHRCPPRFDRGRRAGGYSIISSARASAEGGMVRPRALAVLRLITSLNSVGCSMGRSAGLAPFRILSTYVAARRNRSG